MSDEVNPYQTPEAEIDSVKPLTAQGTLTETMVRYLREAAPWLRFIGILAYIGSGITIAAGIGAIITGGVMGDAGPLAEIMPGNMSVFIEAISGFTGLFSIISGVIALFPARFIYAFGARIRNFLKNNSEQELELAFKSNKSLWKFSGIIAIISLVLIPVITILSIVLAIGIFFTSQ